jgi:UDP-N-acetylmuramoylalanine--D-glutamate ligase
MEAHRTDPMAKGANRGTKRPITLVVGLGETGLSCARYLSRTGESVVVVDSRPAPPALERLRRELPFVPVHLGGFDEAALAAATRIVVSPGVSLHEPQLERAIVAGTPVMGDIELFARAAQAPVAAITGSNGKSTVTSLLGEMARASGIDVRVGGNLGPAALDLLGEREPDLYVLELSSFQLESTSSLRPRVASVLNVSADHMDRYPDLDAYALAKRRVYRGAGAQVINRDDPIVRAMADVEAPIVTFGLDPPRGRDFGVRRIAGEEWLVSGSERILACRELPLRGRHNVANALAALALGDRLGLAAAAMHRALLAFRGLSHRCELVARIDAVDWYDDSKATNVGATVAAINGMAGEGPLVLIAGGDGKGADFTPLTAATASGVRTVILLGRDAPLIEPAIAEGVPIARVASMEDAVRTARELAVPGDIVLLSPACASFDMYRSYVERGRHFAGLVRSLQ